eukprot:4550810-Pyramimonas_sp.AAC.1
MPILGRGNQPSRSCPLAKSTSATSTPAASVIVSWSSPPQRMTQWTSDILHILSARWRARPFWHSSSKCGAFASHPHEKRSFLNDGSITTASARKTSAF